MPELESSDYWPANLQRNQAFLNPAAPTVYNTALAPPQEAAFRQWVTANQVPFNPALPVSDYDMRGFWQALQQGNPIAQGAIDPNDQKMHYPDYWKTPYAATFSAESQWADPRTAPQWTGDLYHLPDGTVLWDDRAQQWLGPHPPWGGAPSTDAIMNLFLQQRGVDPVLQALARGQVYAPRVAPPAPVVASPTPGQQAMAVPPHLPQGQESPEIIAPAPRSGDYPQNDEYGHIPQQGPALTPVQPTPQQMQALLLRLGGVA
jgi:hypothetical protein